MGNDTNMAGYIYSPFLRALTAARPSSPRPGSTTAGPDGRRSGRRSNRIGSRWSKSGTAGSNANAPAAVVTLVMPSGGELFGLLVKERGFGEDKARFFFCQLVEGVKCCHEQGICHRDLKPENLLLDESGNLKISDFGLSSLYDNSGETTLTSSKMMHTTCGSPNYVSPEVLEGKGYDGRKADIWTLGVILYVTTTGRLPFDEPTTSALFAKIQKASFTFPKGVSGLFIDLVSKLLVVNPRERLQLSQIQQSPWCLAGRTASA